MISEIASYQILAMPLTALLGMITFLLLLLTALVSIMNKKGVTFIPFRWHPRFAALTILLALLHGILGLSLVLGF